MRQLKPYTYKGELNVPKSKSYLQRAIAIASIAEGSTRINGYTESNDVRVAIRIAKTFGAKIDIQNDSIVIHPSKEKGGAVKINCGEAGLSTRMFSPIASAFYENVTVDGHGSILRRPMNTIIDALTQLQAKVSSNNSFLPIIVEGGIKAGEITIDGSESSQLLTGLLIALPLLDGNSAVHVQNLTSVPYIQMTLDILEEFGIEIENQNFETFFIKGNQKPRCAEYTVEGDWSGASFHLVGAAISGSISLKGLNRKSAQADVKVLDAIRLSGAKVEVDDASIQVNYQPLKAFHFDATSCPDLFPPLAVLASCCEGVSILKGTHRLTHKESNRALTIQQEFRRMGVKIEFKENEMWITGGKVKGGMGSSRNDHRIAMALGTLASVSENNICIDQPGAVFKSYPSYFLDIDKIAAL